MGKYNMMNERDQFSVGEKMTRNILKDIVNRGRDRLVYLLKNA